MNKNAKDSSEQVFANDKKIKELEKQCKQQQERIKQLEMLLQERHRSRGFYRVRNSEINQRIVNLLIIPFIVILTIVVTDFTALYYSGNDFKSQIKTSTKPVSNIELIDLGKAVPEIYRDMRYATPNNFMKTQLYPINKCLLHSDTVQQLKTVQLELKKSNLGLKVFDCYRPLSIQKMMWKIKPDSRYVANPAQGSRHNRASAVDLTLINLSTSQNVEMPSEFDDFSEKSYADYKKASQTSKNNRNLLRVTMEKHGFKGISTEWWHYDNIDWEKHPLLDTPLNQPESQ